MAKRSRPELFEIPGATWDSINTRVLAPTAEVARAIVKKLLDEGYYVTSYRCLQESMTAVHFLASDDRHAGRANGNNESITLVCFEAEGHTSFDLYYRPTNTKANWRRYSESVGSSRNSEIDVFYGGELHISEIIGRCQRQHPGAVVLMWNTELLGDPNITRRFD